MEILLRELERRRLVSVGCGLSMLVCPPAMYKVSRVPGRLRAWLGRASVMPYDTTIVYGTGRKLEGQGITGTALV